MSAGSLWLEFCGLCANPLYAPRSEAFACCCPFILNYAWLLLPSGISLLSPSPPWKSFLPTLKEFPGSLDGWDSALSAEGPSLVPGWRTRILQASRQGQKEEGVCAAEPLFVQAVLTSSTLTRTPIPTPSESSLGVLCGHVELCVFCQLSSLPHPVSLFLFSPHSVPWVQGNTL